MKRLTQNSPWVVACVMLVTSIMTSRGISQSSNIISGVIDQLNGGGDVIGLDYAAGQKWMLYFVAKPVQSGFASGGIKVLVDLDDYAGVTAEGRDGWVTVWIDVVAGTGVGGWPIGFGVQKRTFGANAPDSPIALFDVTVNASVNSIPVDLFSINSSGGITTCDLKLGVASPLSGGGELSVHGLSFEVRKTNLDGALLYAMIPGLAIAEYTTEAISAVCYPGSSQLGLNIFSGFRLTTNSDDPKVFLIQDVRAARFVQGQAGTATVIVKVPENDIYNVRVWDETGLLPPPWEWTDVWSIAQDLAVDETGSFPFTVTPTSASEPFAFWLYQRDFLGAGKIVEKVICDLYAAPAGTDVTPPPYRSLRHPQGVRYRER